MEVAAPTTRVVSTLPDEATRPVLVVRTTLFNNSGTAYDVGSLIGPSVQYAGGSATRLVAAGDNTGGIPTKILQPQEKFTLESDFSAVTGPLRIKYRDGLQYPAVVFVGSTDASGNEHGVGEHTSSKPTFRGRDGDAGR
jgi:hypothetical protein